MMPNDKVNPVQSIAGVGPTLSSIQMVVHTPITEAGTTEYVGYVTNGRGDRLVRLHKTNKYWIEYGPSGLQQRYRKEDGKPTNPNNAWQLKVDTIRERVDVKA